MGGAQGAARRAKKVLVKTHLEEPKMSDLNYEFEYQPTAAEWRSANGAVNKVIYRGPWVVLRFLMSLLFGCACLVAGFLLLNITLRLFSMSLEDLGVFGAIFSPFVGMAILGLYWVHLARIFRFMEKSPSGGSRTVTVGVGGVKCSGSFVDLQFSWKATDAVVLGKRAITISAGNLYVPIPLRCFDTAEKARTASEKMQRWRLEAISK